MSDKRRLAIAIALSLASVSAAVPAQTSEVRGLDFRTYLSVQRGMTEGQVLSIAGAPELLADQGAVIRGPRRAALALKTYTYMPTAADPHVTTITLVGGRVTDIQRFSPTDRIRHAAARRIRSCSVDGSMYIWIVSSCGLYSLITKLGVLTRRG